jgi:hypothetical protein
MKTTQKLALFKNLKHGHESVCDEIFDTFHDYVRLTEFVEVNFPPLNSEEVVEKQLKALDSAEHDVRTRFQEALNEIERQRQELRAITYTPAA